MSNDTGSILPDTNKPMLLWICSKPDHLLLLTAPSDLSSWLSNFNILRNKLILLSRCMDIACNQCGLELSDGKIFTFFLYLVMFLTIILLYQAPAEAVKPLYLQYARLEEDYGLAKQAMKVYDQATKAIPANEKLSTYEIYIARAAEIFGVPKTREIYEQVIESGLPEKDVKTTCMRYAELEKNLGEIDRACGIYVYASQFADP
uniref:Putative pre-mRNA-splicing factor SYF1 n=1 Tax=Davidia involucrata TaxID=16924 RepID=A0A5B7BHG8_DAVIN